MQVLLIHTRPYWAHRFLIPSLKTITCYLALLRRQTCTFSELLSLSRLNGCASLGHSSIISNCVDWIGFLEVLDELSHVKRRLRRKEPNLSRRPRAFLEETFLSFASPFSFGSSFPAKAVICFEKSGLALVGMSPLSSGSSFLAKLFPSLKNRVQL